MRSFWFRRSTRNARTHATRRIESRKTRRLAVEGLEDRRVLATLVYDAPSDTLTYSGDAAANQVTMSLAGDIYTFAAGAGETITVTAPPGVASPNGQTVTFNRALAPIALIQFNMGAAVDEVTVQSTDVPTTINAGDGGDTINLLGTAATSTVDLNGDAGADVINILATAAGSATQVKGGAGIDVITIGTDDSIVPVNKLEGILGAIDVDGGGDPLDTLNINDQNDDPLLNINTYTLTATTFRRTLQNPTALVTFSTVGKVNLNTHAGASTINVTAPGNATTTVNAGAGIDTINLFGTAATGTVALNGDAGADVINILATTAGSATQVKGGAGIDVITIGTDDSIVPVNKLEGILGAIDVNGGGDPLDTLNINDQNDDPLLNINTYALTATTFQRTLQNPTALVTFSTVGKVNLNTHAGASTINVTAPENATTTVNAGAGIDTINLLGTAATGAVALNGDAGADVINIRATTAGTPPTQVNGGAGIDVITIGFGNLLDPIKGDVTVIAPANPSDRDELNINDQLDLTAHINTYTLTATTFRRTLQNPTALVTFGGAVAKVNLTTHNGDSTINVTAAASATTTVNASAGIDTINLLGTAATSTVDLNGDAGADVINILATAAGSATQVKGGAGIDVITIGTDDSIVPVNKLEGILGAIDVDGGGDPLDTLNINDQNDDPLLNINTYTLTATTFRRTLQNPTALVTFSTVGKVNLNTHAGASTINVTAPGNATTTVNAGAGIDTINLFGTAATGTVALNGDAGADVINILATTAGSATQVKGGAGIDVITIGTDDSIVPVNKLEGILGAIDVNGGGDPLDTLNINDQNDDPLLNINTYALTATTFQRTLQNPTALVTFSTVGKVNLNTHAGASTINVTAPENATTTVNAGAGIDTINLLGTAATGAVALNGDAGADVINIRATTAGTPPTQVNGGAGIDVITIGFGNLLDPIKGDVTVIAPANPSDRDELNINDQLDLTAHINTYTLTATTFRRTLQNPTALVTFGGAVAKVNLTTHNGDSTINVTAAASATTTVNASAGIDTINLLGTAATSTVDLNGDAGADVINILATAATSDTRVDGGTENDTVTIGNAANGLDLIDGPITTVDGGGGTLDKLLINDQLGAVDNVDINIYDLFATTFRRSTAGLGITVDVAYAGFDAVILNAHAGDSTINVKAVASATTTVNAGGGIDRVNLEENAATSTVALNGDAGADVITILATTAGSATQVNGGAESDVITIGFGNLLDPIQGAVTVDGGGGTLDTLNINDQSDAAANINTYTLTATTFQRTAVVATGLVTYAALEAINLNTHAGDSTINVTTAANATTTVKAGSGIDTINLLGNAATSTVVLNGDAGDDAINIRATTAGSTTQVNGGTENDTINIGSVGNLLDPIQGAITVNGGGGALDTLYLSDQGSTNDNTYNLTANSIQRTVLLTGAVGYSTIEFLTLNAGTGDDTITLLSTAEDVSTNVSAGAGGDLIQVSTTASRSSTKIDGGADNDVISIGAGAKSLDDISGAISVDGGGDEATTHNVRTTFKVKPTPYTANSQLKEKAAVAQRVGDTLYVIDRKDANPNTYLVTSAKVKRSDGAAPTKAVGHVNIEQLNVQAGTGADSISINLPTVPPTLPTIVTVQGGAGSDKLKINGTADDDRVIVGVLNAAGNPRSPVETAGVECLELYGNDGDDVLVNDTNSAALIDGGDDDDILVGGSNLDVIFGGRGIDALFGRDDDDFLFADVRLKGAETAEIVFDDGDLVNGGRGTDSAAQQGAHDVGTQIRGEFLNGGASLDVITWLQAHFTVFTVESVDQLVKKAFVELKLRC